MRMYGLHSSQRMAGRTIKNQSEDVEKNIKRHGTGAIKMKCKSCGKENTVKAGLQMQKRTGGKMQRWKCNDCGYVWVAPVNPDGV